MQNLRWRNLEAKTGFAGSPFMMRRFAETVVLRLFPSRKAEADMGQLPYLFLRLRQFSQKTLVKPS